MMRRLREEHGSGTVAVIGMHASAVIVVTAGHALSAAVVAHARAAAAADSAALAAADSASGREPGVPCDNAEQLAALHDATLVSCRLDGLIAPVAVQVSVPLLVVSAWATAGPP